MSDHNLVEILTSYGKPMVTVFHKARTQPDLNFRKYEVVVSLVSESDDVLRDRLIALLMENRHVSHSQHQQVKDLGLQYGFVWGGYKETFFARAATPDEWQALREHKRKKLELEAEFKRKKRELAAAARAARKNKLKKEEQA